MTRDAIARLRALHEAATPAPWDAAAIGGRKVPAAVFVADRDVAHVYTGTGPGRMVAQAFAEDEGHIANAALIAAMRNALPALLDVAEAAAVIAQWTTLIEPLDHDITMMRNALAKLDEVKT